MLFRGKNITEYTAADVQSLIENKVPESKILDYKRELQFDEKSKVEFIYDVSSFYNTEGGCIVVGLDEEKDEEKKGLGIPKLPDTPVTVSNYDNLLLRIQDAVRQSTNPSITNLQFSSLLSLNGSNVFLIGIPKTKSLPAMVTYGNHNRFFKRKANGKYFLDTYELYETFNEINLLEKRIKSFIQDRQIKVSEDIFWPDLGRLSSMLIHVIPISFFDSQIENFSSHEFETFIKSALSPPGHEGYSTRYCLEGFHLFQNRRFGVDGEIIPYNLLFRNGCTETFTNQPFYHQPNKSLIVSGETIIEIIKEQLEKNYFIYRKLSIEPTFYMSIKLNNVQNMFLTPREISLGKYHNFNELQLPITLLSNDVSEVKNQVKNILDILWQSVGANECSPNDFKKVFDKFSID
jgi:hypothetical protein